MTPFFRLALLIRLWGDRRDYVLLKHGAEGGGIGFSSPNSESDSDCHRKVINAIGHPKDLAEEKILTF